MEIPEKVPLDDSRNDVIMLPDVETTENHKNAANNLMVPTVTVNGESNV